MKKTLEKRQLDSDLAPVVARIMKQQTIMLSDLALDLTVDAMLAGVPQDAVPHLVMNSFVLAAINLGIATAFEEGREPSREHFLGACDDSFTEILNTHRAVKGSAA